MITVDAGFLSKVIEYTTNIYGDVSILVAVAIGIPMGFWVARNVISLVRSRTR